MLWARIVGWRCVAQWEYADWQRGFGGMNERSVGGGTDEDGAVEASLHMAAERESLLWWGK